LGRRDERTQPLPVKYGRGGEGGFTDRKKGESFRYATQGEKKIPIGPSEQVIKKKKNPFSRPKWPEKGGGKKG